MNFETYLNQSWKDHGDQSEKVAAEFAVGAGLAKTEAELVQFVRLVTHVMGEHLARWQDGATFLAGLKSHAACAKESAAEKAIKRSIAVLQVAGGQALDLKSFSLSDQVHILGVAASALTERDVVRAEQFLRQALQLADTGLEKNDPANRALAVTGNNLACTLEEKPSRSPEETALMILAAQTGRKYWERIGDKQDVAQAEYRLAMTFLQAKDLVLAHRHAKICVEMCCENKAGDMDMFYAYEVLALVERAEGNMADFELAVARAKEHFEKLDAEKKTWCAPSLKKLTEIKLA